MNSVAWYALFSTVIALIFVAIRANKKKNTTGVSYWFLISLVVMIIAIVVGKLTTNTDINTTEGLQNTLVKKIGDNHISKVSIKDNVLVIKSKDFDFDSTAYLDDISNILKVSKNSKLAKDGVAINQVGPYTDSKGQESKGTDFVIYYSKSSLKSINFKNYGDVLTNDPDDLIQNATGYYLNYNFIKTDNSIYKAALVTNHNAFVEKNFKLYN